MLSYRMSVCGSLGLLTDEYRALTHTSYVLRITKGTCLFSVSLACVLTVTAMTLDVKGKPKVPQDSITSEHRKNQAL